MTPAQRQAADDRRCSGTGLDLSTSGAPREPHGAGSGQSPRLDAGRRQVTLSIPRGTPSSGRRHRRSGLFRFDESACVSASRPDNASAMARTGPSAEREHSSWSHSGPADGPWPSADAFAYRRCRINEQRGHYRTERQRMTFQQTIASASSSPCKAVMVSVRHPSAEWGPAPHGAGDARRSSVRSEP